MEDIRKKTALKKVNREVLMHNMNYKALFKQIGDSEIEYFVSDYCNDETQRKPINKHVERQIAERLKNADDKQKNTNFIIALIYDQGSSDNYTQQKRIKFQTVDLLEKFRMACYDDIKPFKCSDQDRKLQGITNFIISQNIIGSIREHLQRQDIDMATFKESLKNTYCVANKLTDWSITNVTGEEFVIDSHIARVLYRLAVISECEYKGYKTHYYEDVSDKFKEISKGCFDNFGDYKGFAATQYLWFFGKHICKKNNPSCNECKISNCCNGHNQR